MGELFDRVHIIEVELGAGGTLVKKESYRFPPSGPGADRAAEEAEVATIVQFCFPEETIPQVRGSGGAAAALRHRSGTLREAVQQTFSFVLTETDGSKRYGYCRRWLRGDGRRAECACVISLVPSMALFAQLLDIILERRAAPSAAASSASALFTFLRAVLANAFPRPGDSLTVRTFSAAGGAQPDVYTLTRPRAETLADFVSVAAPLARLSVAVVVELWAALLCERRVLVTSADPVRLSATMTALSALLHPFAWQHVFIPVLPKSLAGYVTAPMPFFIGALDPTLDAVRASGMPLEEIYLVSADTGTVAMRPADAAAVLPRAPAALLRNTLVALYLRDIRGHADADLARTDSPANGLVTRAFLRCLQTVFADAPPFFTPRRPPDYRGPAKRVYFQHDDYCAHLERTQGPDAAAFVRALGTSQVFEMYVSDLEDAVAHGTDIRTASPLLNSAAVARAAIPLPFRSVACFAPPPGHEPVCTACLQPLAPQDPCSAAPTGNLYHTRCYVCSQCSRLLEGSVTPQATGSLICDICAVASSSSSSGSSSSQGHSSGSSKFLHSFKKIFGHGNGSSTSGGGSSSLLSSSSSSSSAPCLKYSPSTSPSVSFEEERNKPSSVPPSAPSASASAPAPLKQSKEGDGAKKPVPQPKSSVVSSSPFLAANKAPPARPTNTAAASRKYPTVNCARGTTTTTPAASAAATTTTTSGSSSRPRACSERRLPAGPPPPPPTSRAPAKKGSATGSPTVKRKAGESSSPLGSSTSSSWQFLRNK